MMWAIREGSYPLSGSSCHYTDNSEAVILCRNRPVDVGTIAIIIHGQGFVIHEIRAALVVVFQIGVKVIDTRINNCNLCTGSRPGGTIISINDGASKLNKIYQASSITQAAPQLPQPLRFQHPIPPGPEDSLIPVLLVLHQHQASHFLD